MRNSHRAVIAAASVVALAACSGGVARPSGRGDPVAQDRSSAASASDKGPFIREGTVGEQPDPFRVQVMALERHKQYTVLKAEITYIGDDTAYNLDRFGAGFRPALDFGGFALVDPVAKKRYWTLRKDDGNGELFASYIVFGTDLQMYKGVRYPIQVYYPRLPAQATHMTVLPPDGFGPMTGIPVTEGTTAAKPSPTSSKDVFETPAPGSTYYFPVREPTGKIWSATADLQEYVESPRKSTTQQGDEETIALRTDVLFDFDKAEIKSKAAAVLDEVVEETRRRADPQKPPVHIVGHTDNKGSDAYNQKLSVRRAQAVHRHIAGKLGTGYRYQVSGKGESEPIENNQKKDGSDNPEGRARNRRVDISYKLKQPAPGSTTSPGPTAGTGSGHVAAPAPFQDDRGPVVGGFDIKTDNVSLRLDAHTFYRDGAYLVADFTLTNTGDEEVFPQLHNPFYAWEPHFVAVKADFGAMTVVDPASKDRYYGVRAGPFGGPFIEDGLLYLDAGESSRAFAYYPAPPANVTSVTLDLPGFGKVDNVPIK